MKAWHWVSIVLVAFSLLIGAYGLVACDLNRWVLVGIMSINAVTVALVYLSANQKS